MESLNNKLHEGLDTERIKLGFLKLNDIFTIGETEYELVKEFDGTNSSLATVKNTATGQEEKIDGHAFVTKLKVPGE